jgi:flagellin FlaB
MKRNDDGFTGLEAAIVLIAFVVVAAVFSYVVLGAGFFTTQKAQQSVYSAVGQTTSALQIVGNVYGMVNTSYLANNVSIVNFNIALTAGGTPVDMTKAVLVYSDANQLITLQAPTTWTATGNPAMVSTGGSWAVSSDQNSPTGSFTGSLQPNEQYTVTCFISSGIGPNDQFHIEIRPAIGPAFSITRTIPGSLSAVNLLS